ncbi:MAG: hypothetical protein JWM01_2162 [Arthrobacter sp.]|nr:hypothetical protein [Arthrobacter sp.]
MLSVAVMVKARLRRLWARVLSSCDASIGKPPAARVGRGPHAEVRTIDMRVMGTPSSPPRASGGSLRPFWPAPATPAHPPRQLPPRPGRGLGRPIPPAKSRLLQREADSRREFRSFGGLFSFVKSLRAVRLRGGRLGRLSVNLSILSTSPCAGAGESQAPAGGQCDRPASGPAPRRSRPSLSSPRSE